jgi:hypothetical protein
MGYLQKRKIKPQTFDQSIATQYSPLPPSRHVPRLTATHTKRSSVKEDEQQQKVDDRTKEHHHSLITGADK